MSTDLSVLDKKLPAHLQPVGVDIDDDEWGSGTLSGFPVISTRGKLWRVKRGDDEELITREVDGEAEPVRNLQLVILRSNKGVARTYYASGYAEGDAEKPDCYSNDGIRPAADATNRQCKTCAACPMSQWGSVITENGKQGKACSEVKRLAVVPAGQLNDPMLLRVPAASLKTLGQYGAQLAKRGVDPSMVVTKIGFDYNVAHPALTFKAIRFIEEDEMAEVESVLADEEETIGNITGVSGGTATEAEVQADEPAPKATQSKKLKEEVEVAEAAPKKVDVSVESEPAVEPGGDSVEDYDNIDEALDSLDFDD